MSDSARILSAISELGAFMRSSNRDHDDRLRAVETQLAVMAERIDPTHGERIRALEQSAARYGLVGAGIASAFGIGTTFAIRWFTGGHNG